MAEAITNTGRTVSIASNLPHGLTIHHADVTLTLAGANDPRAIQTAVDTRWGITANVSEDWFDDWAKQAHPAVANGNIIKCAPGRIEAAVQERGTGVKTGAEPINPATPGGGVETRTDRE
jgi:hypothetical protein